MKTIISKNTLRFLVLLIFLSLSDIIKAAPLDDLLSSPELKQTINKSNSNNRKFDDKWFKTRDNLASLFKPESKGGLILLEWIGEILSSEFALKTKKATSQDEFVALELTYLSPQKIESQVEILVAHPRFRSFIEMKLVKRFATLEPPTLPVNSLEKMEIRNQIGILYEHRDGRCSLLFKLPNQNIVNLSTKSCENSRDIIRLSELLNLERLKTKLEG